MENKYSFRWNTFANKSIIQITAIKQLLFDSQYFIICNHGTKILISKIIGSTKEKIGMVAL